jgi:ABC-type nickel/cobalt efflux system permease component RcnA
MNAPLLLSIVAGGFVVAFFHAAIPTHWLPFVLTARVQGWSRSRTLGVTAIAGSGHVAFTTLLGVLIVGLGMEVSRWTGQVFPWIAGGVLFAFGLYFLIRQATGGGHSHFLGGHAHHDGHDHHHDGHAHDDHDHQHAHHDHDHEHEHADGDDGHGHDHEHPHAHGDSVHAHAHAHGIPGVTETRTFAVPRAKVSDRAAILSLLALLTFSPCEGFLPVYVSAIQYGWGGFLLSSLTLAVATLAGMMLFTSLTMAGLARIDLKFLERYENAILGSVLCLLGVIIVLVET